MIFRHCFLISFFIAGIWLIAELSSIPYRIRAVCDKTEISIDRHVDNIFVLLLFYTYLTGTGILDFRNCMGHGPATWIYFLLYSSIISSFSRHVIYVHYTLLKM